MSSHDLLLTVPFKMDRMEKKLAEYRARKARQEKIEALKTKSMNFFGSLFTRKKARPVTPQPCDEPLLESPKDQPEDSVSVISDFSEDDSVNCCSLVDWLYYLLWFVLWLILYAIFIKLQFGTVFLIVSAIVFMYVNTRTGPRRTDEVSAYSVFNRNCESIDGTLKAEQFEREIRYGPAL